jgi:hypothetical protein
MDLFFRNSNTPVHAENGHEIESLLPLMAFLVVLYFADNGTKKMLRKAPSI